MLTRKLYQFTLFQQVFLLHLDKLRCLNGWLFLKMHLQRLNFFLITILKTLALATYTNDTFFLFSRQFSWLLEMNKGPREWYSHHLLIILLLNFFIKVYRSYEPSCSWLHSFWYFNCVDVFRLNIIFFRPLLGRRLSRPLLIGDFPIKLRFHLNVKFYK